MKKITLLFLLSMIAFVHTFSNAYAAACVGRSCSLQEPSNLFIGGGGDYNFAQLASSRFMGGGWVAEIGMNLSMTNLLSFRLAADYGTNTLNGKANSPVLLETSTNKHYSAKAGIGILGMVIGGGYQNNKIEIVSIGQNAAAKNYNYSGANPYIFASISSNPSSKISVNLEGQGHFGNVSGLSQRTYTIQLKIELIQDFKFNFSLGG